MNTKLLDVFAPRGSFSITQRKHEHYGKLSNQFLVGRNSGNNYQLICNSCRGQIVFECRRNFEPSKDCPHNGLWLSENLTYICNIKCFSFSTKKHKKQPHNKTFFFFVMKGINVRSVSGQQRLYKIELEASLTTDPPSANLTTRQNEIICNQRITYFLVRPSLS